MTLFKYWNYVGSLADIEDYVKTYETMNGIVNQFHITLMSMVSLATGIKCL